MTRSCRTRPFICDLDQNGWPDLLTSRNNSTTLAFRNRGIPGRQALRVNLRGPTGNPTAVSTRVRLELTDGTVQTSEVHAGSGLYSQSGASVFFGYPDANPPREVLIRWPSGDSTTHAVEPGRPDVAYTHPARNEVSS